MIVLESVSQVFPSKNGCGPVRALDGINLCVTAGEFVTVVGPSGSGKSTLLFTIGAMLKPTSGAVRLRDTRLYDLPARRRAQLRQREFGFVFQTFNLFPYLTCRDNVALPAILAGACRTEARAQAEAMLVRLGLERRLSHRPAELSVGERQRVAFCRSLINRPVVLLADEPTGNLDPAMADQVMRRLLEINAEGQTIVLVTHNHHLAERGTRVIHLRDGRIETDRPAHGEGQE
jgi:putative ABC transport system ATP-binding protein